MTDTTFQSQITVVTAPWCQDINDAVYRVLSQDGNTPSNPALGPAMRIATYLDTVAILEATPRNHLSAYVFVAGWSTPGDGGGGLYWPNLADTTSTTNGAIVVGPDGVRWYLWDMRVLRPEQFGALGTGDDTLPLQAMAGQLRTLGGGGIIISKNHTVFTNSATAPGQTLFDLTNCQGVLVWYEKQGAITATYPDGTHVGTSWIYGLNNVTNLRTVNSVLNASSNIPTVSGVVHYGVNTSLSSTQQSRNLEMLNVKQVGGLGGLLVYTQSSANDATRSARMKMTGTFNGTFYPANFQGNGDNVELEIVTRDCGRSYFPWNVRHHVANVDSNNGTAFDDVDITVYTNPNTDMVTNDIEVNYTLYGGAPQGNICAINFIQYDATPRTANMYNIRLNFDVNTGVYSGAYVAINKYLAGTPGSPGGPDNNPRGYNLFNVKIGGRFASNTTQACLQLFSQADWTGEIVYNVALEDLDVTAGAGSNILVDGRGFNSAGAFIRRNFRTSQAESLTNIPQGALLVDNVSDINGRLDGQVGSWYISYIAPGYALCVYAGTYSVPSAGATVTLPLSNRGGSPQVWVTPKTALCRYWVNPLTSNSFAINQDSGAIENFDVMALVTL